MYIYYISLNASSIICKYSIVLRIKNKCDIIRIDNTYTDFNIYTHIYLHNISMYIKYTMNKIDRKLCVGLEYLQSTMHVNYIVSYY